MSAKDAEDVSKLATELKLAPEAAQKLLDATDARLKGYEAEVKTRWQATTDSWEKVIESDKDFGGSKFTASKEGANRVLLKYGDPEFIAELNNSRMALHPGLFRMLARMGTEAAPDRIVPDKASGGGPADLSDKAFQRELYPTMHATTKA